MNEADLFCKDDINGNPVYFIDRECTKAYTGHIEDYDKGFLCMEADVADGFIQGIRKEYYPESLQLEKISYMEHNLIMGLDMYFYENGKVRFLTLAICNDFFDLYEFNEDGTLKTVKLWPDSNFWYLEQRGDADRISRMRAQFDLKKISEEIMREGENFDYRKYFEEK